MTRWIKRILLFLVGLYCLLVGVLYLYQEKIIFLSDPLPESYSFRGGQEVEVQVEEGVSLNCLWLNPDATKGVILFLHGNKGNNRRCYRQAMNLAQSGYSIFMPDYRSYGKSDGKIENEAQFFNDMQLVYDHLKKTYNEADILVTGYSIGSGAAAFLAANNNPKGLALIAPYTSIVDLKNKRFPFVPSFLVKYPFDTQSRISAINCPILLFHGERDAVIPVEMSTTLANLQPSATFFNLKDESHRSIIFEQRVIEELIRYF